MGKTGYLFILILVFISCKKPEVSETYRHVAIEKRTSEHLTEVELKKEENNPPPVLATTSSEDTIVVHQKDGTDLKVVGRGSRLVSYTETIDGYTLVRNENKIYEYAVAGENGDLVGSGIKARDIGHRSKYEQKFLETQPKYLRYTGDKLKELLSKDK